MLQVLPGIVIDLKAVFTITFLAVGIALLLKMQTDSVASRRRNRR